MSVLTSLGLSFWTAGPTRSQAKKLTIVRRRGIEAATKRVVTKSLIILVVRSIAIIAPSSPVSCRAWGLSQHVHVPDPWIGSSHRLACKALTCYDGCICLCSLTSCESSFLFHSFFTTFHAARWVKSIRILLCSEEIHYVNSVFVWEWTVLYYSTVATTEKHCNDFPVATMW